MSTSITAAPQRQDPSVQFRTQLTSMAGEFKNALPSHIKPEKFQRVVMTVVQQNPDLLQADRRTLLGSCVKCAADGLIPDGREAALVIFNTKVKDQWVKTVQYMPMLAGIQKRVRNSGEVSGIEAHVIYENDHFVWRQGVDASIEHIPLFPGERGKPIGAYAVAKFKDGSAPQFEVMDVAAINKVRAASKAKDGGPWTQWWDEMARKTVFRRLSKWLPMDADPEDLLRRDDELDGSVHTTAQVVPLASAPVSKLDALDAPASVPSLAERADQAVATLAGLAQFPAFQAYENTVELLIAEAEEADDAETVGRLEDALTDARSRFANPGSGARA